MHVINGFITLKIKYKFECRRDYVEINSALVPLRWMAWESIVEVFHFFFILNHEKLSFPTLLANFI